jgi:hypothetical protein
LLLWSCLPDMTYPLDYPEYFGLVFIWERKYSPIALNGPLQSTWVELRQIPHVKQRRSPLLSGWVSGHVKLG